MKRLLPLVVLLVLVLVAGVWWLSRGAPTSTSERSTGDAAAPLASPDAEPSSAELSGSSPAAAPLADARAATAPRDERVSVAEAERRAAAERALSVRGRVTVPNGCALADDGAVVYAARRTLTNEELARHLSGAEDEDGDDGASDDERDEPAPDDPDAASPLLDGPAPRAIAAAGDLRRGRDLLAHAPVAADGTFELALEPEHAKVWLVVQGRRLSSATAVEVATDAGQDVVLEATCGASLSGRLVAPGAGAEAFEDVELDLRTDARGGAVGPFVRREVEVGRDGRYEVRALPPGVPLTLDVDAERFACTRFSVTALEAGEERRQDLALTLGARVLGRVVDDAGEPVAGATVEAREAGRFFGFDDRDLREVETDAEGRFELVHVLAGKVRVVAEAEGYLENEGIELELVDGQTHEGTLIEVGRGAALAGRVTWPDGRPAVEADVDVSFDLAHLAGMGAFNARRGADGEAETDADGRFSVTGLGNGPFTVKASLRPAEGEERHRARVDGAQPGDQTLALVLSPPLGLRGRVVSSLDAAPVVAFGVGGHEASDGLLGPIGKETAREDFEDDEGRFFLEGLTSGAWTVRVQAEGFATSADLAVVLPQEEGAELVVELVPEVLVSGTVVSPTGTPVAGATVRVDAGVALWREQIDDATGFGPPKTESRGDGSFELAGLAPGTHALYARSDDWARSESATVNLEREGVQDLTLVLRAGGTLTGEVWKDEEPAAGFFVQITRMETFDQRVAFVDADGTFEVAHLDEGTWQVVAMSAGGQGLSAASGDDDSDEGAAALTEMMSQLKMAVVELVEDEVTHVVLGAKAADPVRVRGLVTHSGTPYAGAFVTFYAEGKEVMETMRNTTVAKDGAYSVELDRPGQYVVQIQKVGSMGQQRLVEFARLVPEGSPELVLDFQIPIGRVSGRVEGSDGAPAGGVRVSLHPEGALESGTLWGGQYAETTTEKDGGYDIEGLRPGRYALMAGGAAYGAALGTPHGRVARSIHVGEGEWLRDEDFRLPEASKVKVKVIDASGKPVAEAAVFARDANGHLLDRLSMITTDAAGTAEYAGLGSGAYSLAARKDGLASVESAPIKLGAGDSADVELRMEPGTLLLITIVGEDEELLNARVSVRDGEGHEVNGMLSLANLTKMFGQGFSSKEQRVGPLPPGKYVVEATGPNGEKVKKPVTLNGQDERKLILKFD